jgi:hypothetical protein
MFKIGTMAAPGSTGGIGRPSGTVVARPIGRGVETAAAIPERGGAGFAGYSPRQPGRLEFG